jgi:hypothetical protein
LANDHTRFDVAWASGVLYHMVDPVGFLKLVSAKVNELFLWTHYVPDDGYPADAAWAAVITAVEEQHEAGRRIPLYRRGYGATQPGAAFCGGIEKTPAWLRRSDIIALLHAFGFSELRVGHEEPTHPNGPCFAVVAIR